MLAKLAGHPKFGPKLVDPAFRQKLQMMQTNPQMMLQDPEMMEVLQSVLDVGGAGGMDQGVPEAPVSSTPTPVSVPTPAPAPEEDESLLTDEEKVERATKKKAQAAKEKGNALYKTKDFDAAIAAYDEAFSIDSTNMMYLNNKAAVYIEMGESDKAIEICKEALEVGNANRAKYEDRAKVYQRMAAAFLKKDDMDSAIDAYGKAQLEHHDKATERKMKNLELERKKRAREQYISPELGLEAKERGNTAFRQGNYPQAIEEYEEATKRDPTNAPFRNNLAAAYLKMGLFNDAKREVEKSLDLDKTYVKAWAKKGDIETFMKEFHKAMDSYKAGLAIEPDNALCKQGLQQVMVKINSSTSEEDLKQRQAHAMADPEIQQILQDPSVRQLLQDMQQNPKYAQEAMGDPSIRGKIEKLVAAGVLQVG
jgi:stress-induced-phosphoprotein 1